MDQQTGETCLNCHNLARTFRFKIAIIGRTKMTTYPMRMCRECAETLRDLLRIASDGKSEVTDASEGSRGAEKGGKGSADNRAQASNRPGTPRI